MLEFAWSKRILFIIGAAGALLVIMLRLCSAPDRRLRAEAEKSPLSCALYAAKKSGYYNSDIVCQVAVAFAEDGDFDRAELIIDEVEETRYFVFDPRLRFHLSQQLVFNLKMKANAMAAVAGLYSKSGRRDKAFETLSQALQIAERIGNSHISMEMLSEISSKYFELSEDSQAPRIIDDSKELTLKQVAEICSIEGNKDSLLEPEIEDALKRIEMGDPEKGLQLIRSFGRQYASGGRLVDVATRLAQNGKYDLALEVTRAIVTDGTGVDDAPNETSREYRAEAVAEIALLYARTGPKDERERRKFLHQSLILIK